MKEKEKREDGIYSKLSKKIKKISDNNILVIQVEKLTQGIDVSDIPRDELERRYLRAAGSVALYQNGFRSVERGSGYFLDYQNTDNPVYLQKLTENAGLDAKQKSLVYKVLQSIKEKKIKEMPDYAQIAFDFDDKGNSRLIEELTREQVMEMLMKDAEGAKA